MRHVTRDSLILDGLTISFLKAGDPTGQPIVLLHGGDPGTPPGASVWSSLMHELAGHHYVVAPDRPAQGHSDIPDSEAGYLIGSLATRIARAIEAMALGPAVVIGQSRGALVAAILARDWTHLVSHMVVVNSLTLAPGADAAPSAEVLASWGGTVDSVHSDESSLAVDDSYITTEWVASVKEVIMKPEQRRARAKFAALRLRYYTDLEREKREILAWLRGGACRVPVLIIWGDGDPQVPLETGFELYRGLSQAGASVRLYVLRGGHHHFAEQPREFHEVLDVFLRQPRWGDA